MDRRRFVPSPEGLEGRALLSVFSHPKINLNPVQNLPFTAAQKEQRIANLPFFLRKIQDGRFLPDSALTQLQADLNTIKGRLHPPPSALLTNFDLKIRDAIPHATLSQDDAHALNQAFGSVVQAAGATPQAVTNLKADMNDLARIDSNDVNPVILATNDYAIVLQTILGVGRPIRTPAAPKLSPKDVAGPKGSRATTVVQPHLVGAYEADATIQILDETGAVVGSETVARNGRYSVTFSNPLSAGTHVVRVRAVDGDELSEPSRSLTFKVVVKPMTISSHAAHPLGPLAL